MVSYEWNCENVEYYPNYNGQEKVIYKVHWQLSVVDSELDERGLPYRVDNYGCQYLNVENLENFIAYENVSLVQVQEWVENSINIDDENSVQNLKNELASQLEEKKNPPLVKGVIA